jgi:phosphatidylglycerol:prolipoprotein diacylglycerol transferase
MCSELLRIPITWGGVPIFGFGLVLLVWLGVGGWAMVATARQAGWPAALRVHGTTLLVVAALIVWGVPNFFPGGVPLRGYGIMMVTGSVVGMAMTLHRARQAGIEADEILGLAIPVFLGGVIGARLFYVVEYWDSRIREPDVWETVKNVLAFTEGGLVVYGAFIGAMLAFAVGVARRKLPALAMADLIAPSMMAGLALGRIGCLMNGCCYGGESTAPWAITFPRETAPRKPSAPFADQGGAGRFHGFRLAAGEGEPPALVVVQVDEGSPAARASLRAGGVVTKVNGVAVTDLDAAHRVIFTALVQERSLALTTASGVVTIPAIEIPPRSRPVHPAQIYSAIDAGLLAWVLWSFYPYRRHDGQVMALMLMLHPISRFLLEIIRVDESPVWGTGLSISQNLSIALFAVGVGLWLWVRKKPVQNPAFPTPGAPAA